MQVLPLSSIRMCLQNTYDTIILPSVCFTRSILTGAQCLRKEKIHNTSLNNYIIHNMTFIMRLIVRHQWNIVIQSYSVEYSKLPGRKLKKNRILRNTKRKWLEFPSIYCCERMRYNGMCGWPCINKGRERNK